MSKDSPRGDTPVVKPHGRGHTEQTVELFELFLLEAGDLAEELGRHGVNLEKSGHKSVHGSVNPR